MRTVFIIACFLLSIVNSFGQHDLFPVAKNGKWGLVENTGKFILKYQYDYIEYHKASNQFEYDYRGKKGIIAADGRVITEPIYDDINLIDTNWSTIKQNNKWNLALQNKLVFDFEYDSIIHIYANLFLLYKEELASIYHGQNYTQTTSFFTHATVFDRNIIQGYYPDKQHALYSVNDLSQLAVSVDTLYSDIPNYALAETVDHTILIRLPEQKTIGDPMNNVDYQFGNLFLCTIANSPLLLHAKKEEYYELPNLDFIIAHDHPILTYVKDRKQGLWNLDLKRDIMLPKYEVTQFFGNEIMTGNFGRFGIFDLNGNAILPMQFESIDVHDNVYVVKQNGFYGIYSKQGVLIIPLEYDRIKVYDSNIKCYSKKAITVIKLADDGSIKSQKTYNDYMSISIEKEQKPRRRSSNLTFGSNEREDQLTNVNYEAFGWFRPVIKRQIKDSLIETRGLWGLKDTADSVVIRPQFMQIAIDAKQNLTKAYLRKRLNNYATNKPLMIKNGWTLALSDETFGFYHPHFYLVDNESRKFLTKKKLLSANLKDFENCYYSRAYNEQLFLLDPYGKTQWIGLQFYGNYKEDILRVCKEGKTVLTPSRTQFTATSTREFLRTTGAVEFKLSRLERYIEFEDASWYYINKDGKQLNDQPFQHAEEFKHGLAIVALNNKWGVVDTAMNIIVPIEHQKVKRIIINGKSYFEVSKRVKENYLYQKSTGTLSSTDISKLKHYHNGKWFAQKNGSKEWALVDTNLNAVTPYEFDFVYPFKDGYATIIIKGKKSIINSDGSSVLPFYKSKRIEPLGYKRYALVTSKGMTVINIMGDTLIAATNCKRVIESTADYLVYEERGRRLNILNFKSDIRTPKNSSILSYSLKDEVILVQKNGKKRLFSLITGKYISKPLVRISKIGEGTMIYRGNNGLLGFQNLQGDTLCQPQFKKLDPIRNGWAYCKNKRKRGIVNAHGKYLFDDNVFRVGKLDNNLTFTTRAGMGVINPQGKMIISPEYVKIESYNSSFYKATKRNTTCDLYTIEGKKLNDKSYKDIKAISANSLIVKHRGFDYLYNGVLNKSLSFQNIRPVSSDLYLLDENSHVGMYNSGGEIIVPLRYHKIEIVRDHLQVSFFNSFGYFDYNGKDLADPHYKAVIQP